MADWNDPQSTRSPFGGATINGDVIGNAARDEGLRSEERRGGKECW